MLDERVIRAARERAEVEEWALVLASAAIPHRLERAPAGWLLLVDATDTESASAALETYDRERRQAVQEEAAPLDYGRTYAGLAVALLLVVFHAITGPASPGAPWSRAGSASAELILRGEVWRTVTALTLHTDAAHVFSNAVGCVVFVTAVGQALGPGLGGALILLAGAGGNAMNALLHGSRHSAVGASTAVFGAIGLLGSLGHGRVRRRRRGWLPVAGSIALLAVLGTGERADILAHLFGLLAGSVLGVPATAVQRPPGRATQWALAAGTLAAVVGCWLAAFG